MKRALVCLVAGLILGACTDASAPPRAAEIERTVVKASDVLEQIQDVIVAGLTPEQRRGLTIGVLDRQLTDTSAIVMIARRGESAHYYLFEKREDRWTQFEEVRVAVRAASAPDDPNIANDFWIGNIATVSLVDFGYEEIQHEYESIQAGSYVALHSAFDPRMDFGHWAGGTQWVADTAFQLRFSKWMYSGIAPCAFSMKTSTDPQKSFMTAAESPYTGTCAANYAYLYYSIFKAISPLTATFTLGPTSITSAGTHNWGVEATGGVYGERLYAWAMSTDGGNSWSSVCAGSAMLCSLSIAYGQPSFILRVTITSGAFVVTPSIAVTVDIPPPPPSPIVTISGKSSVRPNVSCSWTADASGGTTPYTYAWTVNGSPVSGNSPELIYQNTGSSFTVGVTVYGAGGGTGTASKSVTVSSSATTCLF